MTDRKALTDQNETPEDVATLYSWANLHGAKYRDFSASRAQTREKARLRVQAAIDDERRRAGEQAEMQKANEAEEAAASERAAEAARQAELEEQAAALRTEQAAQQTAQYAEMVAAEQARQQAEFQAQQSARQAADLAAQQAARQAANLAAQQSARQAAERFFSLENPPTAIFAASDEMALEVISVAMENGIKVPEDISIIGFDDNPAGLFGPVALTTIKQPLFLMGVEATKVIYEIMTGKQKELVHKVLIPDLIVRESCAQPSS